VLVETRDDPETDLGPHTAWAGVESRLASPTGKQFRRTPLSQLATAEVQRIRTTPVVWLLVTGALALVGVSIASGITTAVNANTPLGSEDGRYLVFASAQAGWIFTLVLGILGVAGEYRHRTASATFLIEPRRWRVFAAKVMAHWFVGLLFGLLCGAVAVAIARIWAAASGMGLPLDIEAWRILGGALVTVVLYGLLGVGVGALLRSQMAALATVLGWSLVVEPLLASLWPELGKYFPNGAASALTTAAGPDTLPRGTGTLLFAGYVTAFLLLGLRAVSRRDVTT
jgi:ABC-2 type transport system permease protein